MKATFMICLLCEIFALFATQLLENGCPEPSEIFPCYCEDEDDDAEVFCNHLTTPENIYEGVKGLKGHKIYKLSFFMNWILEPIKGDVFQDLAIERIVFENSTIAFNPPQFKGMHFLNSIQLRAIYNRTNPLVPLDLGHLPRLRDITLEQNRITTLPNDWLKSVPDSLVSVSLEENNIITLGDDVFSRLKKLIFLVLESNRIIVIKRSMFPKPANSLRSLNLNYNKIRFLDEDIFSEMPNLRILEIAGNRLTTLNQNTWKYIIEKLARLDVSENDIECDSNLKWLYTDVRTPTFFLGKCKSPEKLSGKSLSKLNLKDLD